MTIPLTPQQQQAIDGQGGTPLRFVDPRTNAMFILIPESEYEDARELLDDERRQRVIRQIAINNAAGRMEETP